MDWTLEVVIVPVSDLGRAISFYRDQVGFHLDHDTENEHMHVAQLTPPGSGCSIVVGSLPAQNAMAPGSLHGVQLVVADAAAAREELVARGVECSEIQVIDPRDGGTFFGFSDPTATRGRSSRSRPAPRSRSSRTRRAVASARTSSSEPRRCPPERGRAPPRALPADSEVFRGSRGWPTARAVS